MRDLCVQRSSSDDDEFCFYLTVKCFLTTTSHHKVKKNLFSFSCWKRGWLPSWRSWWRRPPTARGWRRSWTKRGRRPTAPGPGQRPSPSWGWWFGCSGGGGPCWRLTSPGSPNGTRLTGNLQHNIISIMIIPMTAT